MTWYITSHWCLPQSARNLILGVSSLAARIGGIIAPQVVLAAVSLDPSIPFIIFGGCGLFAGLISLALPETRGQAMPDTVQVCMPRTCLKGIRIPHMTTISTANLLESLWYFIWWPQHRTVYCSLHISALFHKVFLIVELCGSHSVVHC